MIMETKVFLNGKDQKIGMGNFQIRVPGKSKEKGCPVKAPLSTSKLNYT